MGGFIEETAARAIDRAAGKAIERGASSAASRLLSAEAAGGAAMSARVVAGRLGGAGIAGGVINAGFSAVDQIGAYQRGDVTASQAVGTVMGEAAVGVGAGLAGAAAGAAIGSIIPVAGTIVGGVIGFGVVDIKVERNAARVEFARGSSRSPRIWFDLDDLAFLERVHKEAVLLPEASDRYFRVFLGDGLFAVVGTETGQLIEALTRNPRG
jgi:hypothetical protein